VTDLPLSGPIVQLLVIARRFRLAVDRRQASQNG
jgi:hypothetical protein